MTQSIAIRSGMTDEGRPEEHDANIAAYGPKQAMAVDRATRLANLIIQEPHRFALREDQQLVQSSLEALKSVFDFTIDTEGPAIPAIAATLQSTFANEDDDDAHDTTGQKRKRKGDQASTTKRSQRLFEPTPLDALTTDGMQSAQLWEQLEMRNSKICTLLDAVIVAEQPDDVDEEEEEDDEDDESVEDEIEVPLDEAQSKRKKQKSGKALEEEVVHNLSELSDSELRALGVDPSLQKMLMEEESGEFGEEGSEDEDEEDFGYPGASDLSDDDEYSGIIVMEPLLSEEDQQRRKAEAEARELRQMRRQRKLAKAMQGLSGDGDENDDDEEGEEGEREDDDDDDDDEDFDEDNDEDNTSDEEDEDEAESTDEEVEQNAKQHKNPSLASLSSDTRRVRKNPELDDSFFSIDQFNRDTDDYGDNLDGLGDDVDLFKNMDREEEQEQEQPLYYADFFAPPPYEEQKSKSRKGEQKQVNGKGVDELAPRKPEQSIAPRRSIRFNEEVSVLRIKPRKDKEMQITPELLDLLRQQGGEYDVEEEEKYEDQGDDESGEEDEGDEDEEEDSEDEDGKEDDDSTSAMDEDEDEEYEVDEEEGDLGTAKSKEFDHLSDSDAEQETAQRVAGDLFADEDEDEENEKHANSSHQRRIEALQEEIAQLERENVSKKDWTLMGEANSRARPENSLLEEDVEFESNRKAKPVNTAETTQSLEDMIKKRILESNFDDVQRRAHLQAVDFLPSKMLELSDAKNPKSLDQVYEDEMNGTGDGQGSKLDKELDKEHEEIDRLYEQLENQLDALSNAHFTPKAPKVTIQTISNTPTITLEESLPSTMSHGARLAPEEVYDAGRHNATLEGSSSELTPEEKRRRHRQLRDEKRARNERIAEHNRAVEVNREAFGQHRGGRFVGPGTGKRNGNGGKGAAAEKEDALRKLMGNKGVSVVGKGPQVSGKTASPTGNPGSAKVGVNASHYKL